MRRLSMHCVANPFSKMMKKSSNFITDFVGSLSISCALFHDFVDDEKEFKVSLLNNMEKFLKKASPKDINNLIMSLKKSLFKFTNYEYSWIFVDGLDLSFFALDILFLLIKKELINDEILSDAKRRRPRVSPVDELSLSRILLPI